MNYTEAVTYIHDTYQFGSKLGLENIERLLQSLGNPHEHLKFIHIAGTNGKGSVSTLMSLILKSSGLKTGLFTSPYLEEFRERIQVNNAYIPKSDLASIVTIVKKKIEMLVSNGHPHPTEFEVITAVAMKYFHEQKVDIVLLEVGMGGRLDATNVIHRPELVILTSISMDHSEYLGDTIEKIAAEKAAIIKPQCSVVVYPQTSAVQSVILAEAESKASTLHLVDPLAIKILEVNSQGQKLLYQPESSVFNIQSFHLNLLGKHQSLNALTVLTAAEVLAEKGYPITTTDIETTFNHVSFNGRMEILSRSPFILIDGAHNSDGLSCLAENLSTYFKDHTIRLFFGMLEDKHIDNALKDLFPLCEKIITLTPDSPRAKKAEDTAAHIKNLGFDNVTSCEHVHEVDPLLLYGERTLNAFCGSLYLIGKVRTYFTNR